MTGERPTRIHRFRILRQLGVGSMGRVYLAEDPNIGRRLALKVLSPERLSRPEKQAEMHARFLAEARAAGGLAHPGIVTVYDADSDPLSGDPYLAMELVEGPSLRQILDREAPLDVPRTLDLISQVARALAFAHRHEVVHRDVKPANLLVRPDGVVKVVDFGIAKLVSPALTQPGKLLGTPFYMAPEHLRSKPVDGRSDLFSLGVVFYECLAGRVPFTADSIAAVQVKILQEPPPPITDLSPALWQILGRMLAKDPAHRYANGDLLADELEAISSEMPTQVIPRVRPAIDSPGHSTTELPAPNTAAVEPPPPPPPAMKAPGAAKTLPVTESSSSHTGATLPSSPPPPGPPPPTDPRLAPEPVVAPPPPPVVAAVPRESKGSGTGGRATTRSLPLLGPRIVGWSVVILALVALMTISYGLARLLTGDESAPVGERIAAVIDFRATPPAPSSSQLVLPDEPPSLGLLVSTEQKPLPPPSPPSAEETTPEAGEVEPGTEAAPARLELSVAWSRTFRPSVTVRSGGETFFEQELKGWRRKLEIPAFEFPGGRRLILVTVTNRKNETVAEGEMIIDLEPGGTFRLALEQPQDSGLLVVASSGG